MWNFQDTFETRKRSFISAFSICMTVPLIGTFSIGTISKLLKHFLYGDSSLEDKSKIPIPYVIIDFLFVTKRFDINPL